MSANDNDVLTQVIRKLDRLATLTEADRETIRALPFRVAHLEPDQYLVEEGAEASDCCILLKGYAAGTRPPAAGGGRSCRSTWPVTSWTCSICC